MCPRTTLECVLLEIRLCRLHNSDNIIPLGKGEVWLQSMGEGVSSSGQLERRVDCSVSGREGVGMRGTPSGAWGPGISPGSGGKGAVLLLVQNYCLHLLTIIIVGSSLFL